MMGADDGWQEKTFPIIFSRTFLTAHCVLRIRYDWVSLADGSFWALA